MALNFSKPFFNDCILYSELPYEVARLGVNNPILQKKLKQKNVRQSFKISQSVHGRNCSSLAILEYVSHSGFEVISFLCIYCLYFVEIWWGCCKILDVDMLLK